MTTMTLDRAIDQQIELGQKDPHVIYDRLVDQLGAELLDIAKPYLADFVSDMARQRLNAQRRATIARITSQSLTEPDIKLRSLWVPAKGSIVYKRIADMTAEDFEVRANYLDHLARGILKHAQWCRDVANEMRRLDLKTARGLKQFPELGADEGDIV